MSEHVKFFVCGDVKPPQRKAGDAGCDFFVPNLSEQFVKDLTEKNPGQPFRWGLVVAPANEEDVKENKGVYLYLPAHEDLLIPTYVKARFPDNIVLQVNNKSGVAVNQKLGFGANVIDSSYEGMIHIHVFNHSNNNRFIEFGQKLVQMIPIQFDNQDIEIFYDNSIEAFKEYKNFITVEEFYAGHSTHRGEKGFGEGTGIK
jgi:dUTPase